MDQPPGDGVAEVCGSGRVRPQPAGQRRARGADGKAWEARGRGGQDVSSRASVALPNPPFPPQVLEPRFNVETMALLLNIPPNKTLLRRHLATHFGLLVGTEAQQSKQESLENPDYSLLTATAKVKVGHQGCRHGYGGSPGCWGGRVNCRRNHGYGGYKATTVPCMGSTV